MRRISFFLTWFLRNLLVFLERHPRVFSWVQSAIHAIPGAAKLIGVSAPPRQARDGKASPLPSSPDALSPHARDIHDRLLSAIRAAKRDGP